MTTQVGNPLPMFFDRRGRPLDGGSVYIGVAGEDPEVSPLSVFADEAQDDQLAQPIRTIGGLLTRSGLPVLPRVAEDAYSLRVRDADGAEVFYIANANLDAEAFQPVAQTLTLLAALTTTDFGRGVLEQGSASEFRSYANIPDALPLAGGTVTGPIKRSGAGGYAYANDQAIPEVRFFFTENGAADPRTQAGDVWFEAMP